MERETASKIIKSIRRIEPEVNNLYRQIQSLDDEFEHKGDFPKIIQSLITDLHVDIELKIFDEHPDLIDAR